MNRLGLLSMVNKTTVLVTGTSKKDEKMLAGRTENNRVVILRQSFQISEFVDVQVTEVLPTRRGLECKT